MRAKTADDLNLLDANALTKEGKDSLDGEVWVFDDFGSERFNTLCPVRLEMHLFVLCIDGTATVTADLTQYTVTPNCLIVMGQGTILQNIEVSCNGRGLFVGVSHSFVDEVLPDIHTVLPLIIDRKASPITEISQADSQSLQELFALLQKIIKNEKGFYRRQIIVNFLRSMLYKVLDIYKTVNNVTPAAKRSRNEEIFYRFSKLVESEYKQHRSVQHYAGRLCITPKHLSVVVKAISGNTASAWINNYVILAAKVLLRATTKTVLEISDELNFTNQSFFGKYFKAHTGMSPQAYRQQAGSTL